MKYLSLCLPTNGIEEWVFPVLENIYKYDVDEEEWELIVTDNGDNEAFYTKMIKFASEHDNLIYKKTTAFLFENQIEALRLASGEYLKFVNHRSILEPDAIKWMIEIVKCYLHEKPIMYFSNGVLRYKESKSYGKFDDFVKGLRAYASWTTGVGVWRSDFKQIPKDWIYNKITPHSDVLFWVRDRSKYYIFDKKWCHDIDSSHKKKGKYDLYRAFGVEEITVTLNLFNERDICADTFKYIVKCYERYVANLYLTFNILKEPCSYSLDGFNDAMGIFLSKRRVLIRAYTQLPKRLILSLYHKISKK